MHTTAEFQATQTMPQFDRSALPTCSDCRARQSPAVQRLSTELGQSLTIVTLNAAEHSALADHLGLLTVPSTAVLDACGVVRYVNQGFADEDRLREQLATLE
jgi:thioredoxin-like negative regulator of GroEL